MAMLDYMRIKLHFRWMCLPLLVMGCATAKAAEPAKPQLEILELDRQSEALKRNAIDLAKDVNAWALQQQPILRNGRHITILSGRPLPAGYDWQDVQLELGDTGVVEDSQRYTDQQSNLMPVLRATVAPGTYRFTAQLVHGKDKRVPCALQVEVKPGADEQYFELRLNPLADAQPLQCELNPWQ
jgi:hypothetical protein